MASNNFEIHVSKGSRRRATIVIMGKSTPQLTAMTIIEKAGAVKVTPPNLAPP